MVPRAFVHRLAIFGGLALAAPALAQEPAPGPPPAEPKAIRIGKEGTLELGALLQGWYTASLSAEHLDDNGFRARRTELVTRGEVVPGQFAFRVMIDPSKLLEAETVEVPVYDELGNPIGTTTVTQPGKDGKLAFLQDVVLTAEGKYADISIGQFKNPVSWEGFNSSSRLLLPERALVSREYGDKRDLGAKAEKTFDRFGYVVGLWNGAGLDRRDNDNDKDVAARLEVYPIEGATVAVVGYGTVGSRDTANDRAEVDLRLEKGPLIVQTEGIRAWSTKSGDVTTAQGFYVAAGYTLAEHWQPVARVGLLDRDLAATGDGTWAYEGGVNWLVKGHNVKEQLAASYFHNQDGTSSEMIVLASQLAF